MSGKLEQCESQLYTSYEKGELNYQIKNKDTNVKNKKQKEPPKNVLVVLTILLIIFMLGTVIRNFIYHYRKISSALVYMDTLEDKIKQIYENSPEESYNKDTDKFNQSLCAICLLDFKTKDKVRKLHSCQHIFHSKCIDMWINSKASEIIQCPLCNINLIDSLDDYSEIVFYLNNN